jgi:hypothetical protein
MAEDDEDDAPDIIGKIFGEMSSDGENDSEKLLEFYELVSDREKGVINRVLLYICGWTLPTLIKKVQDPNWDGALTGTPIADDKGGLIEWKK